MFAGCVVGFCAAAGACSDSDTNQGDGWRFEEGDDAGSDASSTDVNSPPERCTPPAPTPLPDGVDEQVLLVNAGWGAPWGHDQEGATWAVAQIFEDGRVELGEEHVYSDSVPVDLYPSGKRAYVIEQFDEPRVTVLDATRGFEVQAEYLVDRPAESDDEGPLSVGAAVYSERTQRHYFGDATAPIIAVVDECAESATEATYIDLSAVLGDDDVGGIDDLYADGTGFVSGVALRGDRSVFFVIDTATNTLVDQNLEADGVQPLELPFGAGGTYIHRQSNGNLLVSTSPGPLGTVNHDLGGGLLELEMLTRPGTYELGEYLVTSQQLQGNPIDFVMLGDSRGVAVVNTEASDVRVSAFSVGDQGVDAEFLDTGARAMHACASSDKQHLWIPTIDAVLAYAATDSSGTEDVPALDQQPSMVPHDCMFAP